MTVLLKISDLSLIFSEKILALSHINLELFEGETLGIVGESGSGKSALAKAILRLHSINNARISGKVLFEDLDLLSAPEKMMQRIRGGKIGMILQDPASSLNPTLRIGEQIQEAFLCHHSHATKKEAKEWALELLDLVSFPNPKERMEDYPHMLSGGMRQRALIAIALAARPKIVIADEPTTALDPTIQAQILDLLKTIQEKTKVSIILITHDLSAIAAFSDRVAVMYAGRIVEEANVYSLFAQPAHPYTKLLLDSIPRLDTPSHHPLTFIDSLSFDPNLTLKGCPFHPRCPHAMKICSLEEPPLFLEKTRCWKYDARSPYLY